MLILDLVKLIAEDSQAAVPSPPFRYGVISFAVR
jgi:hypothetical protein